MTVVSIFTTMSKEKIAKQDDDISAKDIKKMKKMNDMDQSVEDPLISEEVIEESGLSVPKSRLIQLIHLHLVENGLYEASRALQIESGIGLAGCSKSMLVSLEQMVRSGGQWGSVLKLLDTMDDIIPPELMQKVYEMCISELMDVGEKELAQATFQIISDSFRSNHKDDDESEEWMTRMEQLLSSSSSTADMKNNHGTQEKRNKLAQELKRIIPLTPENRFVSLVQQSLKWQSYTGQLPLVENDEQEDVGKKSKKRKRKRQFDLVLGSVDVEDQLSQSNNQNSVSESLILEKTVSRMFSTLKMTKGSFVECCSFVIMNTGDVALITGTTDGFIELWDSSRRFTSLCSTTYQNKDEIMTIPEDQTSVTCCTVTNDGTVLATGTDKGHVYLWNLLTGKCLRRLECFSTSDRENNKITCLDFFPSGKLLLTSANNVVREWGLRAGGKLLKEFRGHDSIVHTCLYHTSGMNDMVLTASLDGTVRMWDSRSAQIQYILCPNPSLAIGSNCSISISSATADMTNNLPIITVLPMHTPPNTILVVPRSTSLYLVSISGLLVRKFELPDVITAACISPSNQWFYAMTEKKDYLYILDMVQGEIKSSLPVEENDEITTLIHHPNKPILAYFSHHQSNTSKRGMVHFWK